MKSVARDDSLVRAILRREGRAAAIGGVCQNRVAACGEVDANLVGAARVGMGFDDGIGVFLVPNQKAGEGFFGPACISAYNLTFAKILGISTDET